MSDIILCAFCGKDITNKVRKERHYSPANTPAHIYCDKACRIEADNARGFFKEMSLAGQEARSAAVAESNHRNPRRKAKASI